MSRHHFLVVPSDADPIVVDATNWLAAAGQALTRLGARFDDRLIAQAQPDESHVIEDLTTGRRLVVWKGTPVFHRAPAAAL